MEILIVVLIVQQIFLLYMYHRIYKMETLANGLDKDLAHVENFLNNTKFVVSEEE